jgi:hypothetical protein
MVPLHVIYLPFEPYKLQFSSNPVPGFHMIFCAFSGKYVLLLRSSYGRLMRTRGGTTAQNHPIAHHHDIRGTMLPETAINPLLLVTWTLVVLWTILEMTDVLIFLRKIILGFRPGFKQMFCHCDDTMCWMGLESTLPSSSRPQAKTIHFQGSHMMYSWLDRPWLIFLHGWLSRKRSSLVISGRRRFKKLARQFYTGVMLVWIFILF